MPRLRREQKERLISRAQSIDYFTSQMVAFPNPDAVLQKTGEKIASYRQLLTDGRVWAGVQSRKAGVLHLEWEINPGDGNVQVAETMRALFDRLDMPRLMSGILDAVLFGYQPLEIVWSAGREIETVRTLPPEWFCFGSERNELRFLTKDNPTEGVEVDERQVFCATNNADYRNPYGEPLLSRCWWPVKFKHGGWKFWIRFSERYGSPWAIGRTGPGRFEADAENMRNQLDAMVQDAIAVIPDDASVELKNAGAAANGGAFEQLILAANTEISTVLLGHAAAGQSVSGQLGAQEVAGEVRHDLIEGDKRIVENAFNRIIRTYMDVSGYTGPAPEFRLWEEEDVDTAQADRDARLMTALSHSGLKLSRNYYLKAYNFEEEDLEDVEQALPAQLFAEAQAQAPLTPEQRQLEGLIERGTKAAAKHTRQSERSLRDAILKAENFEEAMNSVLEAWPGADVDKVANLLDACLVGAAGAGLNDARNKD